MSAAAPAPIAPPYRAPPSAVALLLGFAATAIAGLATARLLDSNSAGLIAAACFTAVVSAAMVISWGAEAAQFFLAQGFAVALIALLQVMPEFMVEAVIAWKGQVENMFANATGSNRLLIGLGWPLIYFTADITQRLRDGRSVGVVRLRRENVLELLSLLLASSYYLKLLLFRSLTVVDGVVLCGCYIGYMVMLSRLPEEDQESKEDMLAPARVLAEIRSPTLMRASVFGLFLVGGGVMAFISEPFVASLSHVAVGLGISTFVFIQWVAPFLSEFPEKVTAFYWSRTVRLAPMALLNMISSTVSQFTLLVGMIPLVYAAAVMSGHAPVLEKGMLGLPIVPMATEQLRTEVFLSWAMTLLGCAQLAKLRFTLGNAVVIFVIWILQFLAGPLSGLTGVSDVRQHFGLSVACIVFAVVEVVVYRREIHLRSALRETLALMRGETRRAHP
jgi:cation:H+ antiporter